VPATNFCPLRSLLILAPWQEHGLTTLNKAEARLPSARAHS